MMNGWSPSSDIWQWLLGVEGRLSRLEERGARMEQSLIRIEGRLGPSPAPAGGEPGTPTLSRLAAAALWLRVGAGLALVAALVAGNLAPGVAKAIIAALPLILGG